MQFDRVIPRMVKLLPFIPRFMHSFVVYSENWKSKGQPAGW
jgi:hypothetical protein